MFRKIDYPTRGLSARGPALWGDLKPASGEESLWELRSAKQSAWVCLFRRAWESGILKEDRWGIKGLGASSPGLLAEAALQLPKLFRALEAASVAARVPMQAHPFVQALEGAGFQYAGGLATLTQKPGSGTLPAAPQGVRVPTAKDQAILENIALEAFKEGRFYHEPGLPKGSAQKIYGAWAKNMVNYANEVWVAGGKKPLGFVSLKKDAAQKIFWIDLIAVSPAAQGKGLGGLLTDQSRRRTPKGWSLSVKTEPENLQAMGFYLKNGFRLESFQLDLIWRSRT